MAECLSTANGAMPRGENSVPEINESKAVALEVEESIDSRLRYGTELHSKVLARLLARIKMSYEKMSTRYADWDKVDEQVRLYANPNRPATRGDGSIIRRSDGSEVKDLPFERGIVIPVSYAILQVRMAQMMAILCQRDPIFPLQGSGPEDVGPARLMETVLDYDMKQCAGILAWYSVLQDAEKYGIGVVYDTWETKYGWRYRTASLSGNVRKLAAILGISPRQAREWGVVNEYNSWISIDPFRFWPDPRVPKSRIQDGEFCGHRFFRSHLWLVENSIDNGGIYFNVDAIPLARADADRSGHSPLRDFVKSYGYDLSSSSDDDRGFHCFDHLQVKLIPREWGIGPETVPRIWWFTIADGLVIVRAHPCEYEHNQFTYSVAESNFDPHALFNPGNIENLDGLQRYLNWLLNSHLENIRKFINNALIFDPTFIEEVDVLNPGPVHHWRLTPAGSHIVREGIPIQNFVYQLPFQDTTVQHLRSVEFLFEIMQRMMGTNDPMMGQPTKDRKTLGEVYQFMGQAGQRVATTFRIYEAQAIHPSVMRAISNRQQFTSLEKYYRIVGEALNDVVGDKRQLITPWDLQGNFDYSPRSDVLPPDPAKSAIAWTQLILGISKFPQLLAPGPDGKRLDVRAVFNEIARNLGVRNISQFYVDTPPGEMMMAAQAMAGPVKIMPDEEVEKQVKAGNLVPILGGKNG
ncbi:MAG: hypothetical protein ABIK44_06485 [candidate division WOR-3 bacterium]